MSTSHAAASRTDANTAPAPLAQTSSAQAETTDDLARQRSIRLIEAALAGVPASERATAIHEYIEPKLAALAISYAVETTQAGIPQIQSVCEHNGQPRIPSLIAAIRGLAAQLPNDHPLKASANALAGNGVPTKTICENMAGAVSQLPATEARMAEELQVGLARLSVTPHPAIDGPDGERIAAATVVGASAARIALSQVSAGDTHRTMEPVIVSMAKLYQQQYDRLATAAPMLHRHPYGGAVARAHCIIALGKQLEMLTRHGVANVPREIFGACAEDKRHSVQLLSTSVQQAMAGRSVLATKQAAITARVAAGNAMIAPAYTAAVGLEALRNAGDQTWSSLQIAPVQPIAQVPIPGLGNERWVPVAVVSLATAAGAAGGKAALEIDTMSTEKTNSRVTIRQVDAAAAAAPLWISERQAPDAAVDALVGLVVAQEHNKTAEQEAGSSRARSSI